MTLLVRGYAGRDSTGPIDVRLGPRRVARQDLTIALDRPPSAVVRGSVTTNDGKPLLGARATVRDGGSTSLAAGASTVTGRPAGTQGDSGAAVGRPGAEPAGGLGEGAQAGPFIHRTPLPRA